MERPNNFFDVPPVERRNLGDEEYEAMREPLVPVPVNEPDDETCPECGGELRLEGLLSRCVKCRNYTEGPCKL